MSGGSGLQRRERSPGSASSRHAHGVGAELIREQPRVGDALADEKSRHMHRGRKENRQSEKQITQNKAHQQRSPDEQIFLLFIFIFISQFRESPTWYHVACDDSTTNRRQIGLAPARPPLNRTILATRTARVPTCRPLPPPSPCLCTDPRLSSVSAHARAVSVGCYDLCFICGDLLAGGPSSTISIGLMA